MSFLHMKAENSPALVDVTTGHVMPYRELMERAAAVASVLGGHKSLVFLPCRNDPATVIAYVATQLAGHAVALLDGSSPFRSQAATMAAYRPEWLIGPIPDLASAVGADRSIVQVDGLEGYALMRLETDDSPIHPDLAVLLATSGTTGGNKFVRLSSSNVEANASSIAEYLGLGPKDRPITSLPLHYSFGLSVLNSHLRAGATVVLSADSVVTHAFWDAVRAHSCTGLAGVPYTYQMLERVGFRLMDLPTIDTLQQAGGGLDQGLVRAYGKHMAGRDGRFFVMYGQTEATARISYVPPERLTDKIGSAGIPIPGGRLRIEHEDPATPGQAAAGEVVYEGPNVMLGYATGRPDLAAGDTLGGHLHTGDIGYLDADGYLYLTGRSKRIAKVFGRRFNLDELEKMLREHGPAAVVAGDDVIWGFCAFGDTEALAVLRDGLSRLLRIHPSAIDLRRVTDIPVSSSGKTDYQQVERWVRR